jgi:hypothetical protein
VKARIGNPLARQLETEFFRITDRENDPTQARIGGETQQKVAAHKTRGTGQKELHVKMN